MSKPQEKDEPNGYLIALGVGLIAPYTYVTVWGAWSAWMMVLVPLGLPAISIWKTWAVTTTISLLRRPSNPHDPRAADEWFLSSIKTMTAAIIVVPIVVWYWLPWLVSA